MLSDIQNGFRRGRSTIDHLSSLTTIVETRKLKRMSTYVAFIDFRKAYDGINRTLLFRRLTDIGIRGHMFDALLSLYKNVECCVRINGCKTDWFNFYINDLSTYIHSLDIGIDIGQEKVAMLLYADDLVLMANSETELQTLLNTLQL